MKDIKVPLIKIEVFGILAIQLKIVNFYPKFLQGNVEYLLKWKGWPPK